MDSEKLTQPYSRQRTRSEHLFDEDDSETSYIESGRAQVWGYRGSAAKGAACWLLCFVSLGVLRLLFHWRPTWQVAMTCRGCPLKDAQLVLIRDEHCQWFLRPVAVSSRSSVAMFGTGGEVSRTDCYRYFTHRKLRYVWYKRYNRFRRLLNADHNVLSGHYHKFSAIDSEEAERRRTVYGLNEIEVTLKPILHLVFLEALNPFYVFQLFSISVWYMDDYVYYASVIVLMSVLSIGVDVYQIRKNQRALRDTICSSGTVDILRHKLDEDSVEVQTKPSTQLVPGDIVLIPSRGCVMQCDAVLLNGNCIVNESMLTGESVPVTKTPIAKMDSAEGSTLYDDKHHAKHTLYNGTRVLQTRYYSGQQVKAVVVRTGYSTLKGQLVRSIMYPKPVDFEFTKDLLRFVGVLACIAGLGFVYTILLMSSKGNSMSKIFKRALDIITIVVPPALPAAMTIGVMAAEQRLKKKSIYCISPSTINTCGGLNVICFDKTGTLTEEGLDLLGIVECRNSTTSNVVKQPRDVGAQSHLLRTMATCHSLTRIEGEISGDPLDVVLFSETHWSLEEPQVDEADRYDMLAPTVVRPPPGQLDAQEWPSVAPRKRREKIDSSTTVGSRSLDDDFFDCRSSRRRFDSEEQTSVRVFAQDDDWSTAATSRLEEAASPPPLEIGILRQLTFSSTLQRMSVVVRVLGEPHLTLYCKGAPETVVGLCRPETVPLDFHSVLHEYTQKGYRVIAAATKTLNMSYVKVQRASRDQLEKDLLLVGLIVLENRLKPQTTPVIESLRNAQIRCVMCTGDNALTAISVARECGLLRADRRLYVVDVRQTTTGGGEPPTLHLRRDDCPTVSPLAKSESDAAFVQCEDSLPLGYQLAITGTSFALLSKFYPHLMAKLVASCDVYARMSPDQKSQLVNHLQELGYIVAMCGDGANDCGALKAAHAGISLSEAEASIASPFTSKTPDIRCVLDVIREGRAALVTSFGVFKYMAGYSLTQFLSVSVLYWLGTNLADFQFLYIDLCLITVFAVFFGYTPAAQRIDPRPPPAKILSAQSVASICLQLFIASLFQVFSFAFVARQPWFIPFVDPGEEQSFQAYQATAIFLSSINQYVTLAVVYSKSHPYRKSLLSNRKLFYALLLCALLNLVIILQPPPFMAHWLDLKVFPYFRYRLLVAFMAALNFLIAIFGEIFLIEFLMEKLLVRKNLLDLSGCAKYVQVAEEIRCSVAWLYRAAPLPLVLADSSLNGSEEITSHEAAASASAPNEQVQAAHLVRHTEL